MTPVTILVLRDDDPRLDEITEPFLAEHPEAIAVSTPPGSAEPSVRLCAAVNALQPTPPLVIVAVGETALMLPAVALSQHAQHRRVAEYVLLDPALPSASDTWPDARVTVVCGIDSDASLAARLRGWDVLRPEDLSSWQAPD